MEANAQRKTLALPRMVKEQQVEKACASRKGKNLGESWLCKQMGPRPYFKRLKGNDCNWNNSLSSFLK